MSQAETSDSALVAAARAGQQWAFSALMQRYREMVWRLARSHVGDADEALDITQESFVSAFASLSRYDDTRPFRVWIARITLNKCRDWGRRRAVRHFFTFAKPIAEAFDVADPGSSPEEALHSVRELSRINAAIAALPTNLREVLMLRTIEAMSEAETAQVLGITEKAVETRLYRARGKLTDLLSDR